MPVETRCCSDGVGAAEGAVFTDVQMLWDSS